MTSRELLKAMIIRLAASVTAVGVILFAPAGTLRYGNGWLFMVALFAPMIPVVVHLYRKDRALLEKRLRIHEKEKEQKTFFKLSLAWFLVSFAIPGFDFRFGWSQVPVWLVGVSLIVMVSGYILFMIAMMQNAYASRVIEIQTSQRVVDKGLYSIVRHPMYLAAMILYMASPLVLGSYFALIPFALVLPLVVYRIRNEARLVHKGLPGYTEYSRRVRFRLIPFVW